jgi:Mg2+/Co2+ transporter CorB
MNLSHLFSLSTLIIMLIALIIISAFYSASETAMMTVNRYKLRHLAEDKNHRAAKRVLHLLSRTDRLLTVILLGNTVSNIFASAVATLIGAQLYGEHGIFIATVLLTFIVLICAEIGPKTLTARYPQGYSFFASIPLTLSLYILYPFVWLGNNIVRLALLPFGINISQNKQEELSSDELRHIVHETDDTISAKDEQMLVGVLELANVNVQDIMIPRAEITGINLEDEWQTIQKLLYNSQHTRLPLFSRTLDNIHGMLHMRDVLRASSEMELNKDLLLNLAQKAYFVPETGRLAQQLINFQKHHTRTALVVDEYGEVHGLITLDDILEEVVGDYTSNIAETTDADISLQADGSYIVDGSVSVRELNRTLSLTLPTNTAITLNGLIIAYLDGIPSGSTCVKIAGIPLEVIKVADNVIKTVRVVQPTAKI